MFHLHHDRLAGVHALRAVDLHRHHPSRRGCRRGRWLGFGRIVGSEKQAPNMFANLL
jgi:hypothetical protein